MNPGDPIFGVSGPGEDVHKYWPTADEGVSMGDAQSRLSILRNANVPCHYLYNFHVDMIMVPYATYRIYKEHPMSYSLFFIGYVLHAHSKK